MSRVEEFRGRLTGSEVIVMNKVEKKDVRYNLRLSRGIYDELGKKADRLGTTRLDLIRRYIILGLLATPDDLSDIESQAGIYVRSNGNYQKLVVF